MHYANGRAAKAGDIVRGKGYNIKHEIVGLLIYAHPGSTACNCQVATVTKNSPVLHYAYPQPEPDVNGGLVFGQADTYRSQYGVMATIEYGQLDAFVAIDPATGEVLPPEE
jgi:hypothetical protein